MKKITKQDIKEIQERIKETTDPKRVTFLKAAANYYSKQLGINPPYKY